MTTGELRRAGAGTRVGCTVLVAVVAFVTTLDNTVITVALPSAARQLRLDPAELEWVGISYMLAFSGLLLIAGAAVDRWGQRRMLLLGLAGFGLAAAWGAAATDPGWLIAARAAQGAAAALALPATLSVIRTALPARERDTAAAIWTAALAVALATGPLIGGALTQDLRWNWALLINVPFALVGIALAVVVVPEHRDHHPAPPDWPGAALATTTAVAATAALVTLSGGVRSGPTVVFGAFAVLCGALFCHTERRVRAPLVPAVLLGDRMFAGSLVLQLLWGLGVSGIFFFTPLFLQDALHLSPVGSGLPLLAVAVSVAVATPFVARSVRRFGVGATVAGGLATVATGLFLVAATGSRPTVVALLPGLALVGLGSAFTTPLTSAALSTAGAEQAGIASGLLSAGRELSGSLGVAVIGAVLNLRRAAVLASGGAAADAYATGYRTALLVAAGLEALAAMLAVRLPRASSD